MGGDSPKAMAELYVQGGYLADDAVLRALAEVKSAEDCEAVSVAARAIYLFWVQDAAERGWCAGTFSVHLCLPPHLRSVMSSGFLVNCPVCQSGAQIGTNSRTTFLGIFKILKNFKLLFTKELAFWLLRKLRELAPICAPRHHRVEGFTYDRQAVDCLDSSSGRVGLPHGFIGWGWTRVRASVPRGRTCNLNCPSSRVRLRCGIFHPCRHRTIATNRTFPRPRRTRKRPSQNRLGTPNGPLWDPLWTPFSHPNSRGICKFA